MVLGTSESTTTVSLCYTFRRSNVRLHDTSSYSPDDLWRGDELLPNTLRMNIAPITTTNNLLIWAVKRLIF